MPHLTRVGDKMNLDVEFILFRKTKITTTRVLPGAALLPLAQAVLAGAD